MKTTQAWGWLGAGVLAAGLNATYHDGRLEWVHQIADQVEQTSATVIALASGQTDRFLAEAQLVDAHQEAVSARVADAMARVQSRIARTEAGYGRVEAMSACEEAQLARIEANEARIEARVAARVARVRVSPATLRVLGPAPSVCPRVRVNLRQVPRIAAPVIHVETPGSGPV